MRILDSVALTMGAEIGEKEGGETKRGEEEGPGVEERRTLSADTGHRGEDGRDGIWTTWCLEEDCMDLAHFTITWAPGGPKIISPRVKLRVGSNFLEEEGARLER